MDLGSLLNPTDPNAAPASAPIGTTMDTKAPAPQNEWDKFMADPVNRAGLLGFGLQMMTGGWGNGASNIAQALGAGVESAAGAGKVLETRADTEQARGDKLTRNQQEDALKREELASQEKRTGMIVAGRKDVAGLKGQMTPKALTAYNTAYKAAMDAQSIHIMSGDVPLEDAETQARASATAAAQEALASGAAGGPIAAPGSGGGYQANSGGPTAGGTTPPPAQPAASEPLTGTTKGTVSFSDIVTKYGADKVGAMLNNPQRKADFEKQYGKIIGLPGQLKPQTRSGANRGAGGSIFGPILNNFGN